MTTLSNLPNASIIIASDLTTSTMDLVNIKGFITERGGRTSHTSIIAVSLGLPALVVVENILSYLNRGDTLILKICNLD